MRVGKFSHPQNDILMIVNTLAKTLTLVLQKIKTLKCLPSMKKAVFVDESGNFDLPSMKRAEFVDGSGILNCRP